MGWCQKSATITTKLQYSWESLAEIKGYLMHLGKGVPKN